jgi:sugar lactone lactonase YvrE
VGGQNDQLWVIDNGNRQILHVNPDNGNTLGVIASSSSFPSEAKLNALTFDSAGNGYVTDHALGRIYKITPSDPTPVTIWSDDRRLKALNQWQVCTGMPPNQTCNTGTATLLPSVGANGIEIYPPGCGPNFSNAGVCTVMLVANTANRNIVRIPINANGTAAGGATLVNGINGPDGMAILQDGNDTVVAIAANQSDEIIVIENPFSTPAPMPPRVVAKLGDFGGIDSQGRVIGLLFPASLARSNDKTTLYVTNYAANTTSIDTPWTNEVTTFTVAKIVLPTATPPFPTTGLFHVPRR